MQLRPGGIADSIISGRNNIVTSQEKENRRIEIIGD
jgi:hypothetical protein